MQKAPLRTNKGFSLVEALLSCALLGLLATGLVRAYLDGEESAALGGGRARAVMLADEGLEALRNMRDADGLVNLPNGTYGLATTSGQWNLMGTSDTTGVFTRQVTISSVDSSRKLAVSEVTWQQNLQRTGSVSVSTYLTSWQCADQATSLIVNTAGATLAGPNRNLVGITVANTNTKCADIRIDSIRVSWVATTGNRAIESVLINGASVWTGSASTGTLLDITDTSIVAGAPAQTTEYQFGSPMNNRTVTLTFNMSDGSTKTISIAL